MAAVERQTLQQMAILTNDGELNDAAVAERWLVGAADQLDANAALAAGRLAQVFWAEGTRHWHGWEKAYRKASSKRLPSWFD